MSSIDGVVHHAPGTDMGQSTTYAVKECPYGTDTGHCAPDCPDHGDTKENPKYVQAIKDGKDRMEYLVGTILRGDARVHAHGADKYGERNWRIDPIKVSTYEAAILRHFMAYFYDREDTDPDSGQNHLYHIRACCAVMLDAEMHDKLIDDRDRKVTGA